MTLNEAKELYTQDQIFQAHITTCIDFCYELYWTESMPKNKLLQICSNITGLAIAEYIIDLIVEQKTTF